MKKFKYKFTTLIVILLLAVLACALGGLTLNIIKLVGSQSSGYDLVLTIALMTVSLLLAVFVVWVYFGSNYKVTDDKLLISFGPLVSAIRMKDIIEINHFTKSDKLVIYFSDKYIVIIIKSELYDDFIEALREKNNRILFDKRIDGEE